MNSPDSSNKTEIPSPSRAELPAITNFGSQLLYDRKSLFQKIAQRENLDAITQFFLVFSIASCAIFGAVLGFHSLNAQILASAFKFPLLIFGTMLICLPALFTFNVVLGSQLSFRQTLTILSMITFLLSAILVSLAPIHLFFIMTTPDKVFVTLLTVLWCTIAGGFALILLWQTLQYLTVYAGYHFNGQILVVWAAIYMFVGTQLSWTLRPFIGTPGQFAWYREIDGNFYLAVFKMLLDLLGLR